MAVFVFHAELNDFLAPAWRGRSRARSLAPHESLKHAIEALGVPHTEVGEVRLNGLPVGLERRALREDDRISVHPPRRGPAPVPSAVPGDGAAPRFVADVHLGRLARYLRFAGYDTLVPPDACSDAWLVALAGSEGRTVLTRDRDLLMHRRLVRGCYVHAVEPLAQFGELARRLRLGLEAAGPSRCLRCNAPLQPVTRAAVAGCVPPRTFAHFAQYWRCPDCKHLFWHGSHWERLRTALAAACGEAPAS